MVVLVVAALALLASSTAGAEPAPAPGTLVIKVLLGGQCGPATEDDPPPRYAPFDAYVHIRDRDSGKRWRVRSGDDGRVTRRLPAGRYRVRPGAPADSGPEFSKQVVRLRLAAGERRQVRLYYDNGCR